LSYRPYELLIVIQITRSWDRVRDSSRHLACLLLPRRMTTEWHSFRGALSPATICVAT